MKQVFPVVLAVAIALASGCRDKGNTNPVVVEPGVTDLARLLGDRQLDAAVDQIRRMESFELPLRDVETMQQIGVAFADAGRVSAAQWCFERILVTNPRFQPAKLRLATLQYVTSRYRLAEAAWTDLMRSGGMDLISLPILGNRTLRWQYEDDALDAGLQASRSDPLVHLGIASRAFHNKNFERCRQHLVDALRHDPGLHEGSLLWARMLHESGQFNELAVMLQSLDPQSLVSAEVWLIRGHLSRDSGDTSGAARCYWEALQRDPNHHIIVQNLAEMLFAVGKQELAERLLVRSETLRNYADVCRWVHSNEQIITRHLQLASQYAEQAGCFLDALVWAKLSEAADPRAPWAAEAVARLESLVPDGDQRTAPQDDLRSIVDLSTIPVPVLPEPAAMSQDTTQGSGTGIAFRDDTKSVGIDFVYEDGSDPDVVDTRLFEFTGGGVGVIDFDLDQRPDLFLVQGGPAPKFFHPDSGYQRPQSPSDRLYRNVDGRTFESIGQRAGIEDIDYGQGIAVGDYNSDGFPDLYVANVGPNRLYRNNGDGTFSPVSEPGFASMPGWTTSCAMADLNGDGLADLYDVVYSRDDIVHTRMCRSGEASVPCDRSIPMAAGQDRLWINRGDGSFVDATEQVGVVAEDGIGLGVVVADFDRSGGVDVFVANDAKANFLFMNQGTGATRLFRDEAELRGIALNCDGRTQACMGVAADDFDGDGLLDLFVTNFYADYNTLYLQEAGTIFSDATRGANLVAVSYTRLGFGSQSLDADRDGHPDLILTNGDVVDFSDIRPERAYRQSPQFLRNLGGGRFAPLPAEQLGPYFAATEIGRGLARLDWNGDGLEDFCVSHIGSRARLVTNASTQVGHFLDIRLVGTESHRDAVGAVITVSAGGRSWTKQLTAGDGYMASNQRQRIFGLGSLNQVDFVEVQWPSGSSEKFSLSAIDRSILVIEGKTGFVELPPVGYDE